MPNLTLLCIVCEQEFSSARRDTKYCRPLCRERNKRLSNKGPRCAWPNCGRRARKRGFCERDAYRAKTVGNYVDPWTTWGERPNRRKEMSLKTRDVENICRICDSAFMATGKATLCSQKCKDERKKIRDGLTCCRCGDLMWKHATSLPQGEAMCLSCRRETSKQREREYMSAYRRKYKARLAMAVSEDYSIDDILDRDGSDCWICERPVDLDLVWPDPMYRSVDHVVPLSKGGHDTLDNVRLSHLRCNATKSDYTDIEEVRSWLRKNPSMATS